MAISFAKNQKLEFLIPKIYKFEGDYHFDKKNFTKAVNAYINVIRIQSENPTSKNIFYSGEGIFKFMEPDKKEFLIHYLTQLHQLKAPISRDHTSLLVYTLLMDDPESLMSWFNNWSSKTEEQILHVIDACISFNELEVAQKLANDCALPLKLIEIIIDNGLYIKSETRVIFDLVEKLR